MIDCQKLEIGQTLAVSRTTPLMPKFDLDDPGEMRKMAQLPPGATFTVHEVKQKRSAPWYRVVAADFGDGWINSIALIGQELREQ